MATLLIFLLTFTFFMLYSTSNRADLQFDYPLQRWFHTHKKKTQRLGLLLLLLSFILYVKVWSVSGIFAWLIGLMTVGSLIVVLMPLRVLSFKKVMVLFLCSLLIELFV